MKGKGRGVTNEKKRKKRELNKRPMKEREVEEKQMKRRGRGRNLIMKPMRESKTGRKRKNKKKGERKKCKSHE